MAGTANAGQAAHMGMLQRVPRTLSAATSHDRPPICRRSEPLRVRNRMREICTSGSVGGGGGNILAYPALAGEARVTHQVLVKQTAIETVGYGASRLTH